MHYFPSKNEIAKHKPHNLWWKVYWCWKKKNNHTHLCLHSQPESCVIRLSPKYDHYIFWAISCIFEHHWQSVTPEHERYSAFRGGIASWALFKNWRREGRFLAKCKVSRELVQREDRLSGGPVCVPGCHGDQSLEACRMEFSTFLLPIALSSSQVKLFFFF